MRYFLVTVGDDFTPEEGDAFRAVVDALDHFDIPASVEERDESQTMIYNAADVDAAFRKILGGA